MQSNKTCQLAEQYLHYLSVIKGRSENMIKEYRTDLLMFLEHVMNARAISTDDKDFSSIAISFTDCHLKPKKGIHRGLTGFLLVVDVDYIHT